MDDVDHDKFFDTLEVNECLDDVVGKLSLEMNTSSGVDYIIDMLNKCLQYDLTEEQISEYNRIMPQLYLLKKELIVEYFNMLKVTNGYVVKDDKQYILTQPLFMSGDTNNPYYESSAVRYDDIFKEEIPYYCVIWDITEENIFCLENPKSVELIENVYYLHN